jgi:hypothetical protein
LDVTEVNARWLQWGGIPRYVYSKNQAGLKLDVQKAITGMDLSLVQKYLGTPEFSEEDQRKISHMVVQYRIKDKATYGACELDFASAEIGRRVVEAKGAADYRALISHYEQARRLKWQGAYLGHLWEHLCQKIIPLGTKGGFTLESLSGKKKNAKILKKKVKVEGGGIGDLMRVVGAGHYFQPSVANFPVIDAAVMEGKALFGLQMTVASRHPPKAHEAAELLQLYPSLQLVWVVDGAKKAHIKTKQRFENSKDVAEKMDVETLKKLEEVPQWLLKLEFPTENPFLDN